MIGIIVLDVETTSLDPERGSIISIGIIDPSDTSKRLYLECRVPDNAEVTEGALKVNGATLEQLHDESRISVQELITRSFAFIEERAVEWAKKKSASDNFDGYLIIAGENPAFDVRFLEAAARKHGIKWEYGYHAVDLYSVCFGKLLEFKDHGIDVGIPLDDRGRPMINGNWIHEFAGIPREPDPHNALNGAMWEAESFFRLVYGKKLLPEFNRYEIPDILKNAHGAWRGEKTRSKSG